MFCGRLQAPGSLLESANAADVLLSALRRGYSFFVGPKQPYSPEGYDRLISYFKKNAVEHIFLQPENDVSGVPAIT